MASTDEKLDEILAIVRELRAGQGRLRDPWMTVDQASLYLSISRARLYKYVGSGVIPCHRLPGSNLVRLNRHELDDWVRSGRERAITISDEQIRRLLE